MTVFISDMHLGNKNCQAAKLDKFFDSIHERETIYIVGDGFDDHQWKRWPAEHQAAIMRIFEFKEIVWICGNHDWFMMRYKGFYNPNTTWSQSIQIAEQVIHHTSDGKKYLVTHGHQFDWMMKLHFCSSRIFGHWVRSVFHKAHSWFDDHYCEKLYNEARTRNYDGVICGHNHNPEILRLGDEKILYVNCGDWFQSCSGVIEKDGEFSLISV